MIAREELAAWLRLTRAPGIGGETQRTLLRHFGSPEVINCTSRSALRQIIGARADGYCDFDPTAVTDEAEAWLARPGHHLLTLGDPSYPRQLLDIPDPPTLLYVRGNPALLGQPALAIVGSRNATPQGRRDAEHFARYLADSGLCITSGLALGIDAAAHQGALAAGGSTVAVIGTGADRLYPASNRDLALEIVHRGAIVSELPLGTPALAGNFPRRNRILCGLARGVLVVEAAVGSGSLITARLAAEQGREVFAIPGSIHSPVSRGCHQLIKQGAKLVETAADILEEMGQPAPFSGGSDQVEDGSNDTPAGSLLALIGHTPCLLDELAARSGLPADRLLGELLALEMAGRVASLPGNRYQRLD